MTPERQMAGAAGFGGGQEPRNQQNSGAAGFGGGQEIPAVNNQQQQNWYGFGGQNYQGVGGQEQMRRPAEGRPGDEEDVMYYYQTEQTQQPFATDTTGTGGEATGLGTVTEARVSEYFGGTDATPTPTPTGKGTGAGDKYML